MPCQVLGYIAGHAGFACVVQKTVVRGRRNAGGVHTEERPESEGAQRLGVRLSDAVVFLEEDR